MCTRCNTRRTVKCLVYISRNGGGIIFYWKRRPLLLSLSGFFTPCYSPLSWLSSLGRSACLICPLFNGLSSDLLALWRQREREDDVTVHSFQTPERYRVAHSFTTLDPWWCPSSSSSSSSDLPMRWMILKSGLIALFSLGGARAD